MSEEKLRILKMLEEGKITAQEAENLLRALGETLEEEFGPHRGFGRHFQDRMHAKMYAKMARVDPGRIVAEVMREVNPGKIVAEVMSSVGGVMQDLDFEFPGRDRKKAEEEQAFTFQNVKHLDLVNLRGDVTIIGSQMPDDGCRINAEKTAWGEDEEEARERLKNVQVSAQQEGDLLKLKVEGGPWTRKLHAQVDFEIQVPTGCDLSVKVAKGDLSVKGTSGGIGLQAASGDIDLRNCSGKADLSTANGDITIEAFRGEALSAATINGDVEAEDVSAQISLSSVSGDINTKEVSGGVLKVSSVSGSISLVKFQNLAVEVQSQSGDVEIQNGQSPEVRSSTVSGDIQAELAPKDGNIAIRSTSGDVDLALGKETDAQVECETMSGDIDVDLPIQKTFASERKFQGVLGSGKGRIRVSTTSGDISLH